MRRLHRGQRRLRYLGDSISELFCVAIDVLLVCSRNRFTENVVACAIHLRCAVRMGKRDDEICGGQLMRGHQSTVDFVHHRLSNSQAVECDQTKRWSRRVTGFGDGQRFCVNVLGNSDRFLPPVPESIQSNSVVRRNIDARNPDLINIVCLRRVVADQQQYDAHCQKLFVH